MRAGFWIILGVLAVLLLGSAGKSKKNAGSRSAGTGKNTKRIDHLHYIDLDEYECPNCGAKFKKNVMVCPKCGIRFSGTEKDDNAFIEEMEIWDDDD